MRELNAFSGMNFFERRVHGAVEVAAVVVAVLEVVVVAEDVVEADDVVLEAGAGAVEVAAADDCVEVASTTFTVRDAVPVRPFWSVAL